MQRNVPKVSVIMNCYNSDKYLDEAIDSVYSQSFDDWEIIFWDNASTDNSAGIARSRDEKLGYFRGTETVPLGEARNMAIQKARGEYIAFLDCDDIWLPEKLSEQVYALEEDPETALVYTNIVRFDERGDIESFGRADTGGRHSGRVFRELLKKNFIAIASVMVRKECLLSLEGMFDERFSMGEDWDLWLRLAYKHKISHIDRTLTKWRVNPQSWTHRRFILYSDETRMILKKLTDMYPDLFSDFEYELKSMETAAVFYEGIGLWFRNEGKKARNVLAPHMMKNLKFFFGYMSTFLPQKCIRPLEKVYFKLNPI